MPATVRSPSQTASFSRSAAVRRSTCRGASRLAQVDVGRARVREPPGACRRPAGGTTPPTRPPPDTGQRPVQAVVPRPAARAARSWRSRSGQAGGGERGARVLEHRGDRVVVGTRQPAGARRRDPNAVPRSTVSAYADTCSGARPIAVSTARRQSSSDCSGTPNIRSIDRLSNPAARAARTHAGPAAPSWLRPSAAQQPIVERLHADRQPVDAARRAAPRRCASSTSPGLTSTVISSCAAARPLERRARRVDHARERVRAPQPGRAAAEVDRHQRPRPLEPARGARRSRRPPRRRTRRAARRRACRPRSRNTGSARCRTGSGRRRPAARPAAARRPTTSTSASRAGAIRRSRSSRHQLVAGAVDREDVARLGGVLLDLLAQLDDEVVDGAGGRRGPGTPQIFSRISSRVTGWPARSHSRRSSSTS